MADFSIKCSVQERRATIEVLSVPLKDYVTRLQAEIFADPTISAYHKGSDGTVLAPPVVADEDITRLDINAMLHRNLFVIHGPASGIDEENSHQGRDDNVLTVSVSSLVKKPGFDRTDSKEVALMGDGDVSWPGVLEMQEDLDALLHNNGRLNKLVVDGEPFLWNIEWDEADLDDEASERVSGVLVARRRIVGHRFSYLWT